MKTFLKKKKNSARNKNYETTKGIESKEENKAKNFSRESIKTDFVSFYPERKAGGRALLWVNRNFWPNEVRGGSAQLLMSRLLSHRRG
jgi:hypothetical protein